MKKLQDFDLLSFYNKRKLCESALQSLGYDPNRLPRTADPGYGHSQLDSSGDADDKAYDAQINALMDGASPPSFGAPPSSSGATSTGLSGGFPFPLQCSTAFRESNAKDFDFCDTPLPDFHSRRTGQQGEET